MSSSPLLSGSVSRVARRARLRYWRVSISTLVVISVTLLVLYASSSRTLRTINIDTRLVFGAAQFPRLLNGHHTHSRSSRTAPLCAVRAVVNGTWIAGTPLRSKLDLYRKYNFHPDGLGVEERCDALGPALASSSSDSSDLATERLLEVASYDFEPADDRGDAVRWWEEPMEKCVVADLDTVNFMKRTLRSRLGLMLVGDSLTQQQHAQINNLFTRIPYIKQTYEKDVLARFEYRLDMDNVEYASEVQRLIAEAGVTQERAKHPLVTFARHHHLTTATESAAVFAAISPTFSLTKEPVGADWYARALGSIITADIMLSGCGKKEEPSVFVLNVGPHWNGGELGFMTEAEFRQGYAAAIRVLDDKLRSSPFPLSTYWRANMPGQVDCIESLTLDNARDNLTSPVDSTRRPHNYHWFGWMNGIMAEGRDLERAPAVFEDWFRQRRFSRAVRNPASLYMDVWPMTVKRPEAHRAPPKDCLHWCEIGVPDHMTRLMWHMMVLESRNFDYVV